MSQSAVTPTASPSTGIQARHQAELDQGRFLIQHCAGCDQHLYYPRELCPHCGSDALSLVAPAGTGTVYSTTVVRRQPEAGGDYNVALIDLDEGVRLMSRVSNLAPEAVAIGLRVQARVQVSEGRGLVLFDALIGDAA
ncbi:OB-fold domain-containing protein [Curvibacter sp. HBC61]|uniref:OB-fold domain-containing protein n=1 Tax=Curvibacter cyanobacteriorum TaxID=3026422 RepID=A0ABT5MUD6_9BURK|nr:OB-fold domain-containing protein [Curvibacter sp. HBC61]MDD0837657.1 OB-fold domain-containing protein [Curvibacter sp. HBC61]